LTLPYPIVSSQTDAKSPVDDSLMDAIRLDLDYLDTQLGLARTFPQEFKINGRLDLIPTDERRRIDSVLIADAMTFQTCKMYLETPGDSGLLDVDVRRILVPNTPITEIARQYSGATQAIARAGSGDATQSITRAASQITTQSIARWKSTINISSIVPLGSNLVRYNLASAIDSDWVVGDSVTIASATAGGNNGTFTIVRANDDGLNNIVVTNASGVAQAGSAGNIGLNAWSYVFTNPVAAMFTSGVTAVFASHTSALNDGTLTIYAINQGGNNIIVKNATGVAQGTPAGTVDTNAWTFAFSGAVSSDYVAGEYMNADVSHTNVNNRGNFLIIAVNSGGNNLIVVNSAGVVQGGAAGTVNTNRWVYTLATDPSAQVTAADRVILASHSSSANDGTFTVKEVNRSAGTNIVVANTSGVAQAGVAGTVVSTLTLIKFASDQSATYTTDSKVELFGTASAGADDEYSVVQVNRGGGSNFNIVIDSTTAVEQVGSGGRVIFESKSLFDTRPSLNLATSTRSAVNRHGQIDTSTAVFNTTRKTVTANTRIGISLVSVPDGQPSGLVLQLV